MIDRYERNINYLRVSITDRCNLRCAYCMPKEGISGIGHDDILRYEEILRIVQVATGEGITKIRITGGEPLVRRGVAEFIASLRTIPELTDISLTTNGILLETYAEQLFAAGIRRINISLDSLNADKYTRITRGGDIDAVLRGIRKVREIGFDPIKINIVAIKGFNDDEVLDFARLTLSNPYQIRSYGSGSKRSGHSRRSTAGAPKPKGRRGSTVWREERAKSASSARSATTSVIPATVSA
jgi:cyclic pyranopterin phosphate synthase